MKSRKSDQAQRKSMRRHENHQSRKKFSEAMRSFETLEDRRLLTAQPWSDGFYYPPIGLSTAFLPSHVSYQEYASNSAQQFGATGGSGIQPQPEGSLGFATVNEVEGTTGNDNLATANFMNLGTGASQNDGLAIVGDLTSSQAGVGDQDYFEFNFSAGDIIDAVAVGDINTNFDLAFFDSTGREIIANQIPIPPGLGYPVTSPLSTSGNVNLAFIAPADGTYYARLSEALAPLPVQTYTLTLRARRPVLEAEPVGTVQTVFLDFDGAQIRRELFGVPGQARLSPLSDFLAGWGLQPTDEDRVIDKIIEEFTSKFYGATAVTGTGGNGDFFTTGVAGDFGIRILNSRDHADPFGQENVSRIIIGGTVTELGIVTIGIAESTDIGNFETSETAVVLLDGILTDWGNIPRAASVPLEDLLTDAVGSVAAHEFGHLSGAWHTINTNALNQIMDTGGNPTGLVGVGLDGIYGTPDDEDVQFGTDTYDALASGIQFGLQNSAANMAWGLATGKSGGGVVNGNVFDDRNLNRTLDASDLPIADVTVYADANANGLLDTGEAFVKSGADGAYTLVVSPGTYTIREVTPSGYRLIAPTGVPVTLAANESVSGVDFANELINTTITGQKWNDLNGNGERDPGESGLEGVTIYIDTDGDNRIDIGEPQTKTGRDGTYSLVFPPGPGTFTIREIIDPGFIQTRPGAANDDEYTITLTGDPTVDAERTAGLDFFNALTIDYGDAPESYGEASHGFIEGLILGSLWDAEEGSQFSAAADGDDNAGTDDEDSVVPVRPFAIDSSSNTFSLTTLNTTGDDAFLQAWIDKNQDGDFTDDGEQIFTNLLLGSGTAEVPAFSLADAVAGTTFARIRYSHEQDLEPTGSSDSGEVEDYVITIDETFQLAEDDFYTVSRGSVQNVLDVLTNDFQLPGDSLQIVQVSASSVGATLQVSADGTIIYTPPAFFVGTDTFTYTMQNSAGDQDTATVTVNVDFFFEDPVAVDDSFDVPTNAIDLVLNVLQNDIEGQDGALTILSVTQPDQGGSISIATGGKSLRYTPLRGFGGTESFTYDVADAGGNRQTATVTVHTLPGDREDDLVSIQLAATDISGAPISAIQQGQPFFVQVIVDDLRFDSSDFTSDAGVFAAYLDLLYSSQLASTVPATNGGLNFEVDFQNGFNNFQRGDGATPGVIDDFGAFKELGVGEVLNERDPIVLATIPFTARAQGIAEFVADPADSPPLTDTILFNISGSPVPIEQIRFGRTEIEVVSGGTQFPFAVDDNLPNPIPINTIGQPIDVLANDVTGSSGPIQILSKTDGAFGLVSIDTQGTSNTDDDRLLYTPNSGFNGGDQFTYTIQDSRGFVSTAQVTVQVGDAAAADVALRLEVTDLQGQPIEQIGVGEQFQLRGFVQDQRGFGSNRGVFSAYEDVLYSSALVSPVPSTTNDPDLGFEVTFGPSYQRVRRGDIRNPGIINEIGAVQGSADPSDPNNDNPLGSDELLLFRVTMTANAVGTAEFIGDPADLSPINDTLTFEPVAPVAFDDIMYGFDSVTIVAGNGGGGAEGFHNASNPFDVNADGFVSPIDALSVINSLNQGVVLSSGNAGAEGEGGGDLYVDTNNDGALSAIDALLVINHLNDADASGEAAPPLTQVEPEGEAVADAAPAPDELVSEPSLLGDGSAPTGTIVSQPLFASDSASAQEAEDGLDALLEQLAPEIEETWKKQRQV